MLAKIASIVARFFKIQAGQADWTGVTYTPPQLTLKGPQRR